MTAPSDRQGAARPPRTSILTSDEMDVIVAAARTILRDIGVTIDCDEALAVLGATQGADVSGTSVRIDSPLVDACLATTPAAWTIHDRQGAPALRIGESRTYYGTADVAPFIRDHRTGERRPFVLEDVRVAGRLIDALPNIDFACPFGTPTDRPPLRASVDAFAALVRETTKPIAVAVPDLAALTSIVRIAAAIAGGEEALRARPCIFSLLEPISPLTYSREAAEKIIFMADRGLPFFIGATVSLGATAPVTLAGALAQGLAEDLAGLVLAQSVRPGSPVGIGVCTGVLDMTTGVFCYGAPEHALGTVAGGELARHLGVPSWSNGNSSQSKLPDQQAAVDAFLTCLLNAQVGTDVVYDCGYLESGIVSSLEMLVLSDEQIGAARRLCRGIDVSEDEVALPAISRVGPGGHFLDDEHTADHFRDALWRPVLADRLTREAWEAGGAPTVEDRVGARIEKLLAGAGATALPDDVSTRIAAILEEFPAS